MPRIDNGLRDFKRRLAAVPTAARQAARVALAQSAEEVAAAQRLLAPVKDGDLKDSIVVTPPGGTTPGYSQPGGGRVAGAETALVTAGNSKVRYAHLVEFGHKASGGNEGGEPVPAHPFFWPGYRLTSKRARGRVKRTISKSVKAAYGR